MTHPISHLRMERYHLGELAGEELAIVQRHLEQCAECRVLLDEIVGDDRPLPDLPTLESARQGELVRGPARWWSLGGALVALAAAALLWLRPPEQAPLPPGLPPGEVAWKGGVLAVELARQRQGEVTLRPTAFREGDRIQVRVSCPPGEQVEVAVLQGGTLSWPLDPVACGNRVVAGALALSGGQETAICAVADPGRAGPGHLGETACVVLRGE